MDAALRASAQVAHTDVVVRERAVDARWPDAVLTMRSGRVARSTESLFLMVIGCRKRTG